PYLVADDSYHFNRDIAANYNFFIEFARQNQHDVHSFAWKRVKSAERERILSGVWEWQPQTVRGCDVRHCPSRTRPHRRASACEGNKKPLAENDLSEGAGIAGIAPPVMSDASYIEANAAWPFLSRESPARWGPAPPDGYAGTSG